MATLVGIDIGSRYTKVVEIEPKPIPKLINAIIFKTPYASVQNQIAQAKIDTKSFWQEITKYIFLPKINVSVIGIDIPASSITTICLLLPRMSKNELAQAAINEARRKMIPVSGPEHIFEWFLMGEKIVAKIPRFEVLVVRTERKYIESILDIFKDVDNMPSLISPTCCTVPNIIPLDAWKKDEDVAFVDMGAGSLTISICRQGNLVLTRNVTYGLWDIVQDFSRQLSLSEDETENIIREQGVPGVPFDFKDKIAIAEEIMRRKYEANQRLAEGEIAKVDPLELAMLWQSSIERIIHELRRSFAFYKEQSEGRRIEHIYFLGGGSEVKNLITTLSGSIGGQCKIIDENICRPIFVNAASLALANLAKDKKQAMINFLPIELKKKKVIAARRLILLFVGSCFVLLFGLASANTLLSNHLLNISIKRVESELSRVKEVSDRLKDLTQQEERIRQQSTHIEEIIKQRQDFYLPLKELARVIPQEILLTQLSISKVSAVLEIEMSAGRGQEFSHGLPAGTTDKAYQIKIKAQVFSDYEEATKIIENFRSRLESTGYFSKISITPLKLEEISSKRVSKEAEGIIRLTQSKARDFVLTAELTTK